MLTQPNLALNRKAKDAPNSNSCGVAACLVDHLGPIIEEHTYSLGVFVPGTSVILRKANAADEFARLISVRKGEKKSATCGRQLVSPKVAPELRR